MSNDVRDFVSALKSFVQAELISSDEAPEYNHDSLQILDARNHLFRNVGNAATDEENNIYEIVSLCRVDENTMDVVPDEVRMKHVARNYFEL